MMYLTRMWINPRRRKTALLTTNRQMMHAAVEAAFSPDVHDREHHTRPLWRVDKDGDRLALYIMSPERPSLTHLQEQIGWEEEKTWATTDYSPVLRQIQEGDTYGFRLVANPVRRVTSNGKKKLCHHVTPKQQLAWLTEREDSIGVRFTGIDNEASSSTTERSEPTVHITKSNLERFRRGSSYVTLSVVQFDGCLTVQNPEKFRGVLTDGLGRGKAYGCGLLTLSSLGSRQ